MTPLSLPPLYNRVYSIDLSYLLRTVLSLYNFIENGYLLQAMANYTILVDSSTKPKEGSGYGASTAAWAIERNGLLIRSGLIYCNVNGPNKTIYEGMLAALATLECEHFYEMGTDSVKFLLDSQIVIDQLNDKARTVRMKNHKKLVLEFSKKHSNVTFEYSYQNEKHPPFKIVDTLSKIGRTWMPKMLKRKKIKK